MTDNNLRPYQRDPRTGRFVSTANVPESAEGKFETYTELPVEIQGAHPAELAYGSVARHAPAGDDLGMGGQQRLLQPRTATLVHPNEAARDTRDVHNEVLRSAARDRGPMDPSYELVTGFGTHGAYRAQGV